MASNVLKNVKARRNVAIGTKRNTKKEKQKNQPQKDIKFNADNAYEYFIRDTPEEINEAINSFYLMNNYPKKEFIEKRLKDFKIVIPITMIDRFLNYPDEDRYTLLKTINKAKDNIPMSLLKSFFKMAKTSGANSAFASLKTAPSVKKMRELIEKRRFKQSAVSQATLEKIKTQRDFVKKQKAAKEVLQKIDHRNAKHLIYDRRTLGEMKFEDILKLAEAENIKIPDIPIKSDIIAQLLEVENAKKNRDKIFYNNPEIIPKCESEYRVAPWAKKFFTNPIVGIALKRGHIFASNMQLHADWYKPKESWYKHVCRYGRTFVPGEIGYIVNVEKNKNHIMVETEEMFYESLKPRVEELQPGFVKTKHFIPTNKELTAQVKEKLKKEKTDKSSPQSQSSSQSSPHQSIVLIENDKKTVIVPTEYTPGLFNIHLKKLINEEQNFKCYTCGNSTKNPIKSVNFDHKVIYYCDQKCIV